MVFEDCTCDDELFPRHDATNRTKALKQKLVATASILMASALGVSLPILSKKNPTFRLKNYVFFLIKAFAVGVILATAFVHILPDGYESLSSPCLSEKSWGIFSFSGFLAMVLAIATMMIDTFAMSFYKKSHFNKALPTLKEDENGPSPPAVPQVLVPIATSAKAPVNPALSYVTLASFSWDQDNDKVKIYVSLEGVEQEKIQAYFKPLLFDVKFHEVKGRNYRCAIPKLNKEIELEKCKVIVKPTRVIITLFKASKDKWSDMHYSEDKV
ncbi:aspartic proteinase nepenthesin-1-like [Hibiscus syriacus]|uniref:Aspartic proteinase nepenthesin-1-like n=1 Tax=Hibiscus syriacus TaxID=106335 RepID=A0A6A2YKT2_HIBSY|nr:aspartic proteinase nepenthesin-1-like [Hibiscus syriacus]